MGRGLPVKQGPISILSYALTVLGLLWLWVWHLRLSSHLNLSLDCRCAPRHAPSGCSDFVPPRLVQSVPRHYRLSLDHFHLSTELSLWQNLLPVSRAGVLKDHQVVKELVSPSAHFHPNSVRDSNHFGISKSHWWDIEKWLR